jgi:hypothetical protein
MNKAVYAFRLARPADDGIVKEQKLRFCGGQMNTYTTLFITTVLAGVLKQPYLLLFPEVLFDVDLVRESSNFILFLKSTSLSELLSDTLLFPVFLEDVFFMLLFI